MQFLAFALIAIAAFFAFFPFERLRDEIGSAVSERIAQLGVDLKWASVESDFFRTVTLNDVVLRTRNEHIDTLNFRRVTLYFPILFLLRKGAAPVKIGLEDSEITTAFSQISGLLSPLSKGGSDVVLPSLFFRRARVTFKDLQKTFVFSGRVDDGHLRVHARSGQFSASSQADRESPGLWKIQSSVKNMDFFSLFLSTPLLQGENFSGSGRAAVSSGKIKDAEIAGVVTADTAVFREISFPGGEVLELKDIKSVLSVSNGRAEFSGASARHRQLRLRGGMTIDSLYSEPLAGGSFRLSGGFTGDDLRFEGVDAVVSLGGFLARPVLKLEGSAESFKKGGIELKQLTAKASFNDRNSQRFRIESFDAKYGNLDINGKGGIDSGVFFMNGMMSGVFKSGTGFVKLDAPYELGKYFRAAPEIAAVFYGRELNLTGEVSYSIAGGTALVKLDDSAGKNVLSAKLLNKNGDLVLEEAALTFTDALAAGASGSAFFRDGLIKTLPGGFSLDSSLKAGLSFFRDSGKFELSYSASGLNILFDGAENFFNYAHSSSKGKTSFELEGKTALTGFKADGKYDSGNLKGRASAGDVQTDFSVSGATVALTNIVFGQYAAGELTFSKSISGEFFVKDYPLKIPALKKDEKLSGRVKIDGGAFEAELSGAHFSEKLSGTLSLSGLSELKIKIADSGPPPSSARSPAVGKNSLSGDFRLLLAEFRPKELAVSRAMLRMGPGRVEFVGLLWDMERRSASGRVQMRNIKTGIADIFANSLFEIDYSSGFRIKGKADDVFVNALYAPFSYDVLISSEKTVFTRPDSASDGIQGVWTSAGGAWEIFTGGSRLSARWDPRGDWALESAAVGIEKLLKLLNSDIEAFGDTQMSLAGSGKNFKLSFDAPDIYAGAKFSAKGGVSYDGDFVYPDVRIAAAEGFMQIEGYIAATADQVNRASLTADNVKIPVIQTSFGEIRNFSASGKITAGGTYGMPQIEGKINSAFRLKHRDYPESVALSLEAAARGGKILISSDGTVKGADFRLTGEAQLASGGLKNYSLHLQLPEKGVPVVVPGLLIERKKALRYILGAAPSYGKISGHLTLADDGENVSVEGRLKIKDARFSYQRDSLKSASGPVPNMDVTLVFEQNVEWISDRFTADIYGSLNIKGAPYEVNGKLSSNRGRLTYLGKKLDIDFAEIDIAKNKIFLTLQAEAAVSRKNPDPPFDAVQDTIRVDIRHSPLESLDINLASKDFSDKTSGEQAYQMITGVPSAAPGDLEFMRREIAKVIDSSIINPFFSEIFRETGLVDDVRLDASAMTSRAAAGNKLDGLDAPESMNLYMGKSFGRMYLGYNMEFMRDTSSLQLFRGFEIIYRIKGDNILRAVYQPDENGDSRRYLGVERRIRF